MCVLQQNLWFAAENELFVANLWFPVETELYVVN